MVLMISMVKKLLEYFMKKNYKKQTNKNLKVIKILMSVPVDLSKLSDLVKNDVVTKTEYDKLVEKVRNIDTSGFVLKTKLDTGKTELEKKLLLHKLFIQN